MFTNIAMIFKALKEGESLFHIETWKNVQLATNAIALVITCIVIFVPNLGLSASDIQDIAMGVALIGGVINGYFTAATTKKIGFGTATVIVDELPNMASTLPKPIPMPTVNSLDGGKEVLGK